MASSKERREQAAATAAALREKQARAAARQRTIAISGLVVGLVVVGVLIAVILNGGSSPTASSSPGERPAVATGHGGVVFDASGVVAPPESATFTPGASGLGTDWPQGSGVGDGAVVVSVYFDLMCPICGEFEKMNGAMLDQLRADGTIVVDSHPVAILDRYSSGTKFSTRAAAAVWAVADNDPDHYFPFIELMLANQPPENSTGLTDEQIAQMATQAGVTADAVATFSDEKYLSWAASATDLASQDLSQLGTPTILINGKSTDALGVKWYEAGALKAAIEAAKGS